MKNRHLISIFVILTLFYALTSCSTHVIDSESADTKTHHSHTTQEEPAPLSNPATQVFDSIRSMKESIEISTAALSPVQSSLPAFYELVGLSPNYVETGVEWTGDSDYFVYYSDSTSTIAYMPFTQEDELNAMLESSLINSGTYESLINNSLVSGVVKTEISTAYGSMYECSYNTRKATGLKLIHHEYTDTENDTTYVISNTYDPSGNISISKLFVFCDATSFFCIGSGAEITMDSARVLTSVPIS